MPHTGRKAEKRNKIVYERGKRTSSGPKDKFISPLRNTVTHNEEINASMTILKPFSASKARTSFHRITEKTEIEKDSLRSSNPTSPPQAGSARAGCPAPCLTGTPCSQPLIMSLAQLTPFDKASSRSLWANESCIHSISLIIRPWRSYEPNRQITQVSSPPY